MTTISRRSLLRASGLGAAALLVPNVPNAFAASGGIAVGIAADPLGSGFWKIYDNGRVTAHGSASNDGTAGSFSGTATGIAAYPTGLGFWRVRGNGRVGAFGAADMEAGPRDDRRGQVVGIAPHHRGDGFWRVTSTGQVLARGRAEHLGGASQTDYRVVAIAAHPESAGYWILNSRGKVFAHGAARALGGAVGFRAVGIAAHPGGDGYWIAKRDGRVYAFGTAQHHGNASIDAPIVDIAAAPDGGGYWLLASDGRVRSFGSAKSGMISTAAPNEPEIETVGGITVASAIAPRVRRLLNDAEGDGIRFGGWGYRSYSRQVDLRRQNCGPRYFDVYVKSSSECSPMTAVPGRSMHEKGLAVDFYRKKSDGTTAAIAGTRAFTWLSKHADEYGLYNLPSEPWHWSTTGG